MKVREGSLIIIFALIAIKIRFYYQLRYEQLQKRTRTVTPI